MSAPATTRRRRTPTASGRPAARRDRVGRRRWAARASHGPAPAAACPPRTSGPDRVGQAPGRPDAARRWVRHRDPGGGRQRHALGIAPSCSVGVPMSLEWPGEAASTSRAAHHLVARRRPLPAGLGAGLPQAYVLAGVVQRTMSRIRTDVEEKINRLPLSYVDRQPRGDLLSRVTNDIDNVAQSLQQTLGQMLTSLFTIVGVLVMMLWISRLLALIALVTIPLALLLTKLIASRSKSASSRSGSTPARSTPRWRRPSPAMRWSRCSGARRPEARFNETNDKLYQAGFAAQFIIGIMQPSMMFLGNLNYVAIAVIGGLRVASGTMSLGDVQAFIQYSRQFTQPLTQVASMANLLQSGVASAERVFEVLDADEERPTRSCLPRPRPGGPGGVPRRLVPLPRRHAAHRAPVAGGRTGPDRGHRGPHGRRQDHPGEPDDAVLRH
ncbi:ABC transporter ATP-binding protein [Candidatus Neomicrothrix sp.]|uniref:ABC transporter permease n=1 Tax=Candidatus Neomicrothrix sp. TaxID=2719034 RepID=UPI003CD0DA82